ncbi:hypothetical protein Dimus_001811 [Dionaea muscipula]
MKPITTGLSYSSRTTRRPSTPAVAELPSSITVEGKTHTIAARNLTVCCCLTRHRELIGSAGRLAIGRGKADECGARLVIVYGEVSASLEVGRGFLGHDS